MSEIIEPTSNSKPALLLDVDGVLFIDKPVDGLLPIDANSKSAHFNPLHSAWLRRIGQVAEPYYLSASVSSSSEEQVLESILQIPEFDWIDYFAYWLANRSNEHPVKRDESIDAIAAISWDRELRLAAVEYYMPNRDIVWIDDLMGPLEEEWADKRELKGLSTLLIKPNTKIGLEIEHMEAAERWLGSLIINGET